MRALNRRCGLLLGIYLLTIVQCAADCTLEDFKQGSDFHDSFDVSNLRPSYANGDVVRLNCQMGYRGFVRLICSEIGWVKKGDICRVVLCGHPGDVPFADFALVKGDDYVFGSQVRYTCHSGYYMTSYSDSRNCLLKGWDGHLPVCEPISCPALTVNSTLLVNGDIDQPTSGSVLQFSCRDRGHQLVGPSQIFCDEKGQWSDKMPFCREISCPKPQLDNFVVEREKTVYKENDVLRYSCDRGYIKVDGRPSVCKKQVNSAQWTPMPRCELITCKLSLKPPTGTTYEPQNHMSFRPGQSVRVTCGDHQWVKSTELQTAELICQETGEWDFDPVCKEVTCQKIADHVYEWERKYEGYWRNEKYHADLGETLWYRCHQEYEETSARATCTRRGWEPKPLCKERRCTKPFYKNANIIDSYQYDKYNHNERVMFECAYDRPTVSFYVDCHYGEWTGRVQRCKEKPCGTKPSITNGELDDQTQRTEYDHGEILKFRCHGETDPFTVTCKSGLWEKEKTCEDVPCTTKPNIPNAEMVTHRDPPYKHGQSVSLRCTTETDEPFNVTCQSGEWMPKRQCREVTCDLPASNPKLHVTGAEGGLVAAGGWVTVQCEGGSSKQLQCLPSRQWSSAFPTCRDSCDVEQVPDSVRISPHGVRQLRINQSVTFSCKTRGHVLQGEKRVTCLEDGLWSHPFPSCAEPQSCGSPPPLDNGDFFGSGERFSHNSRVRYQCQSKYTMQGGPRKTCLNGEWTGEIKCLKPCTVNPDLMEPNKIQFKHNEKNKLYAPHEDHITFTCIDGATHDGVLEMRQICLDGVMNLPTCV